MSYHSRRSGLCRTQAEAVDKIDAAYATKKPTMVAFANANALNVAAIDTKFRSVLKGCLVMKMDGAGRRRGEPYSVWVAVPAEFERDRFYSELLQEYPEYLSHILPWEFIGGCRTRGQAADWHVRSS